MKRAIGFKVLFAVLFSQLAWAGEILEYRFGPEVKEVVKHYDVIVIGSGGGTKLVRPVASLGYKVAIIEKGPLGGTCLNRGCIPSKMLIHAADVVRAIGEAHRFEVIPKENPEIAFSDLMKRVKATVDEESVSIAPLYDQNPNIDYFKGSCYFIEPKVIQIGNEKISADKILISVGAEPYIPEIKGLENVPYMTYEEALRLEKQPKKALVIGGGYIACELGYFYGALGTEVEFIVRSEFLRNEDKDVRAEFDRVFSERYTVHKGWRPIEVAYDQGIYLLTIEDSAGNRKTLDGDALCIFAGVKPCTETLGLENTHIATDERGFINVDDRLKTSQEGVWSLGDCIGQHLFRHSANFQGEYLFRTLYGDANDEPIVYPPMPHAVFSYPQVGSVGKTEDELIKEGADYVVGLNHYKNSAMGMALRSEHGFVKLLFDRESKKLIGAHVIGDEASNMVHMLIAFMSMNATIDDLLNMIYIHPALPEIVRNAARKAKANF